MSDYSQVKFRPGKGSKFEQTLAARASEQTDSAYSQIARDDLENYYALLSLCLPEFSYAERHILRTVLNGWLVTPEKVNQLWVEVDAYLDTTDVSMPTQEAFIARLRSLSRFECWCIVDAWQRGKL